MTKNPELSDCKYKQLMHAKNATSENRTTAESHDYKQSAMELLDLQIIFFAILCKLLDIYK